ncbi:hypothetical protein BKA67DRAFT_663514 [Truncatella angustata]|uniref:Hypervirulence associated protein TUDOR domain-containing protein n=1 Tax=Truncatella angustata TaxID=152316 RepID=A0A9P8RJW6_9PEZI|nr:uncharacterized protein BKA67DRAFT_663514 [Truncatella angustata]KAH6647174.1 hypothetical protein BKA67DRAFT_663514 [Truncatella angustata]KAH8200557.1 hypothetical protein TruAng_005275 [Truncatella angustata]
MTGRQIHDKTSEPIKDGYHVYTKIRGGRHEGDVEKIVTSTSEAEKEGVKNPPKVLFTDQEGKDVAHNPQTLEVKEQPEEYNSSDQVGA